MKVLIVEDDIMWQCKLQIIAERAKLEIVNLASNLAEVELILQSKAVDLIIADIHLNDENIFALLSNKAYRDIPTILTTASETREDFLKSKKLTNSIYLVKPFHHHTLLSTINILKKSIENASKKTIGDNLKINSVEIRNFYKLLGEDAIIDLFKLKETEAYILKKRWSELETFSAIGKGLKLSSQRIQRIYSKILDKIKTKTLSSVPKYQEYLEFSKNKKNRLEIAQNTIRVQKVNTESRITKFDLEISIDSFEELSTKVKNVLWDKKIRTIEDLLQYSKRDLSMFRKLGPFAILAIEKALKARGFELRAS